MNRIRLMCGFCGEEIRFWDKHFFSAEVPICRHCYYVMTACSRECDLITLEPKPKHEATRELKGEPNQ